MTPAEIVNLAQGLARLEINPDDIPWDKISPGDRLAIHATARYIVALDEEKKSERTKAQKRAQRLLRTFLNSSQLVQFRNRRSFTVIGSLGGHYRIWPGSGTTEKLEKHGKRWYAKTSFCLHDSDRVMPEADVALGHLLLLSVDEASFLEAANHRPMLDQLWNGEYLRRLREARRRRQEAA